MSNDNEVFARLFKLWAMICKMIMDGKRSAEMVAARLQEIVDEVDPVKDWEAFYLKAFGLKVDLSGVKIPEKHDGFDRLIIVAQGLTNNQTYDVCKKHFSCYRYRDNLDEGVPTNDRDPKKGPYAIWVRATIEADEVHKNKSANMVKEEKLVTEILLERMLHELKYFLETGEHLDIQNWTLCSGSRGSVGGGPGVGWYGDKFYIGWSDVNGRDGGLRPRQVITL